MAAGGQRGTAKGRGARCLRTPARRRSPAASTGAWPGSLELRSRLNALVQALLQRETLGEEEILQVTGRPPAPALPEQAARAAAPSAAHAGPA